MSKIYIATDSSPVDMQSYELCSDMIDVVIDVSLYIWHDQLNSKFCSRKKRQRCNDSAVAEENEGIAYDAESSSIIKLNNGMVLYLREVNKYLALVCLLREEHFEKHGLIDYNFQCFKNAIQSVFDARRMSA